jgi:hypothetical protein
VAVVLHALWDASQIVSVWLALLLTGTPAQWLTVIRLGELPGVTQEQVHLFTLLSWGLLGVVALVGLALLLIRVLSLRRGPTRPGSAPRPIWSGSEARSALGVTEPGPDRWIPGARGV